MQSDNHEMTSWCVIIYRNLARRTKISDKSWRYEVRGVVECGWEKREGRWDGMGWDSLYMFSGCVGGSILAVETPTRSSNIVMCDPLIILLHNLIYKPMAILLC